MFKKASSVSYFRNFIFGVEDSLVSTVGLLSGIAMANVPRETILLTGIVLIFAEAFSMASGTFLSESSAEGYAKSAKEPTANNFISGIVMFLSYFISGFIPLSSYVFWPVDLALKSSIVLSIIALFILGVISGKISKTSIIKSASRMAIVGGIAIAMGSLAGAILMRINF